MSVWSIFVILSAFEAEFGFSARNLWDMRRIYLEYKDYPKLRQLVAEIPWGQNLVILNKVKQADERFYYLSATKEQASENDAKNGRYQ